MMTYTLTNNSLMVMHQGRSYTVSRGSANFERARTEALAERWDQLLPLLSAGNTIQGWLGGDFAVKDNLITYKGDVIDQALNQRLLRMATEGANPSGWLKFWERLQQNPSYRSVHQLYAFMARENIPIDVKDGFILAYKSVTSDYKDHHSRKIDNTPGAVVSMPRNKISDDPSLGCHVGLHLGALPYALAFGSDKRIVICKVDPADVVCVPYDESYQKMRVCRYSVVGNYSGEPLPSTVFEDDEDAPVLPARAVDENGVQAPFLEEEEDPDEEEEEYPDEEEEWVPAPTPEEEAPEEVVAEPIQLAKTVAASPPPVPGGNPWAKYDAMSRDELQTIMFPDLRKYARHGVLIIGASKMKATKIELIDRIIEVRTKRGSK